MGKMCFDKRVLGVLAVAGLGILVLAPNLFATALPLLLVAACPLSMLFMGKVMMGGGRRASLDRQMEPPELVEARYRTGPALDRSGQVALLRAELLRVGEHQQALAEQLARLEGAGAVPEPTAPQHERALTPAATRP